jgi:hemolysin III
MLILDKELGYPLLAAVWSIAAIGILIKFFWVTCPKWFSSVLYIAMGWICIFVFGELWDTLPQAAFLWLLAGGVIYTVGGVIYALKCPVFNGRHKWFGSHEIFHLFVMAGSICHFVFMYCVL